MARILTPPTTALDAGLLRRNAGNDGDWVDDVVEGDA